MMFPAWVQMRRRAHCDARRVGERLAAHSAHVRPAGKGNPSDWILSLQRFDALSNIAKIYVAAVCLHERVKRVRSQAGALVGLPEIVVDGDPGLWIQPGQRHSAPAPSECA